MKLGDKRIEIGDRVAKTSGDYTFEGHVVTIFIKRSGVVRIVVEDDRGVLFIFDPDKITKVVKDATADHR